MVRGLMSLQPTSTCNSEASTEAVNGESFVCVIIAGAGDCIVSNFPADLNAVSSITAPGTCKFVSTRA